MRRGDTVEVDGVVTRTALLCSQLVKVASQMGLLALLCYVPGCSDSSSTAAPTPPPITVAQTGIAIADFNQDGRPDLAVSAALARGQTPQPGEVEIFLHGGPAGTFLPQRNLPVETDPSFLAVADMDRDGLPDIVTANQGSDSVSVLFNTASMPGTFSVAQSYPCGPAPLGVSLGDLNADGLPDIAVAVSDGVDILFQDPAALGTFISPTTVTLPLTGGTFSVAVGDVTGDHLPDIVCTGTDAVFVFFQSPGTPGLFTQPIRLPAGVQPNGLAIADVNRDGLLDIVAANIGAPPNENGSSVSILLQDPVTVGSFLPAINIPVANGARSVAVGDVDGNRLPDIIVASTALNTTNPGLVSVLLQEPLGTFTLPITYSNGTALSLALGDLNLDGFLDIAIQDGPSILFQDPLHPGVFFNEVILGQ